MTAQMALGCAFVLRFQVFFVVLKTKMYLFKILKTCLLQTDSAENDSDIWDDTALIKAYDKAINALKVQAPSIQSAILSS